MSVNFSKNIKKSKGLKTVQITRHDIVKNEIN